MASVSAAMGRPDTVTSRGASIACMSGQRVLMFAFSTIAGTSSNTKAPAKLVEYAHTLAAASTSAARNDVRATCVSVEIPPDRSPHVHSPVWIPVQDIGRRDAERLVEGRHVAGWNVRTIRRERMRTREQPLPQILRPHFGAPDLRPS